MNIEKYKYLWDGSEEGWVLHHIDHMIWNITYLFSPNGPSKNEIIALHKIVPAFKDKALSAVLKKVKGIQAYEDEYLYGNIEARRLESAVRNLSLEYKLDSVQIGGYLPVSKENVTLIIEDDQTNIAVCKKTLDAGIPVIRHTYID